MPWLGLQILNQTVWLQLARGDLPLRASVIQMADFFFAVTEVWKHWISFLYSLLQNFKGGGHNYTSTDDVIESTKLSIITMIFA